MAKKKGFWEKFNDTMASLPDYIDEEINSVGDNNIVINGSSSVKQTSVFGSSKSVIKQGGKQIVITTKNGKTTITVNGKEWEEKK